MESSTLKENLKKYFYSGVGLASHTGEIVQKSVNEFVKQGKVSEAEGKKIVDSTIKKIESRMPEFEAKYHKALNKATKFINSEVEMIKDRIASGEKKGKDLKKQVKAAVKSVEKKVAAKAPVKAATKAVKKAVSKAASKSAVKAPVKAVAKKAVAKKAAPKKAAKK